MITEEKQFLENLLTSPSPSGYEEKALGVFKDYCESLRAIKTYEDSMGNVAYSPFKIDPSKKSILISGHIDEIGFQISMITDEGLLHAYPLGGVDRKCLLGQEVEILSSVKDEIIPGIIGKKPIHTEKDEDEGEMENLFKLENILIDIGAKNKKEAQKYVSIGDPVVVKRNCNLDFGGGNLIMSRGLDDKIGVYISAMVLQEVLKTYWDKYNIYVAATVQEEVGLRGAMRLAKNLNPTYSIDIDVTFATDEGRNIEKEIYGDIKLGGGPVIEHGPDKSNKLIRSIKNIAKSNKIKYQESVSYAGGTNTAAIQECSLNTETVHIAVPQRNMHTPVELCSWEDVNNTINLIYHTLSQLEFDGKI